MTTKRNYGNEMEWAAQKYGRLDAKLDKDLVDAFKAKLESKDVKYRAWLIEQIHAYLKEQ